MDLAHRGRADLADAFLAMDLAHRGRADLADAFVDAYVQASGDGELRRLLDFYCCYRAFVRGKVLSLRLHQSDLLEAEATHLGSEVRAYFDLAWAYAGGLGGPTLIVTLGLPASGKSTLAEGLAGRLGLVHVSSDLVRKELAGVHPREHLADGFGEGAYSPSRTRRTYAALRRRAARWLRRGRSVVLDATFGQPQERAAIRRLAARANARLVVLHCTATEDSLRDRLAARSDGTKTGASDARLDLWPALKAAFSEPTELAGVQTLDTSKPSEQTLADALAAIQGELA
ncbi:MAG: AAA family ATPase [Chloroflexota bacterium]|nr:AAA family ATPase [Chloroflexota bacterium]